MKTSELAKVVWDDYHTNAYPGDNVLQDVLLEYVMLSYDGGSMRDLLPSMIDMDILDEVRGMANTDQWARVLELVILWHLETKQSSDYFVDA